MELDNFSLNLARLSSGIVVKGLTVSAVYSKNTLMSIYFVAKVYIVDLISVTFVHITSEDKVENSLWGKDTQLGKNTEELALGDVTALGNIKVLELGLQVDTTVKNCCPIVLKILFNLIFLLLGAFQVLASCSNSILASDWLNRCNWILIDTLLCESEIDGCAELGICKLSINVVSLSE